MSAPEDARLETRRDAILAYEAATARAVAARVVEKPALSVWMILIPIVFLHYMQRQQVFRQGVKDVAEELLRTRRRALDAACRALAGEAPAPDCATVDADDRLGALRAAEQAEVELLARHYRSLLLAAGDDYATLARSAYGNAAAYAGVLDEIAAVERAVSAVAFETQREVEGRAELFDRLARARTEVRAAALKAIFG